MHPDAMRPDNFSIGPEFGFQRLLHSTTMTAKGSIIHHEPREGKYDVQ
jgi:hypothetical protein